LDKILCTSSECTACDKDKYVPDTSSNLSICVYADEPIVCSDYTCIVVPENKVCKCGNFQCACADSLDDIVCDEENNICNAK
jgi:hypothetical protein